ncbi:MAG TPA: Crp/Fnr family transcriptional regulator [Hyphomonadaceae bacterium]|nr:Crp/Fnr family transcriptional regulator [Hyphomonadaceae bacterium]
MIAQSETSFLHRGPDSGCSVFSQATVKGRTKEGRLDNDAGYASAERLVLAYAGNWIAALPPPVQEEMNRRMRTRVFAQGDTVSVVGSSAEHMHQVVSGTLKLVAQHASGEETLLAFYLPGSCWAETAIVADRPLHHTTIALTEASVASLSRSDFWDLYRRHSEIPEALCRKFAVSLSRTVRNRELRESLPLKQLVLMALQNLADVSSIASEEGWRSITIPLTQTDLGACFGVTRQSIQTVTSELKSDGVIQRNGRIWLVRR